MRASDHRLLILAFYLSLPFSADAAGLGELRVLSALGERFRAEIPVVNATASISQGCFHLATTAPEAISEAPWLDNNAHVAFEANPPRLLISTRRPMFDPVVQLAFYTGCGSYLTRHFVALLSPPKERVAGLPVVPRETRATVSTPAATAATSVRGEGTPRRKVASSVRTALPGETARDMARRLYPRSRAAQKRFVGQMVALNPDWLSSLAGDELLPAGADLNYPQPARRKKAVSAVVADTAPTPAKAAEKRDRLVLSPSEPLQPQPAAGLSPALVGAEISARISGVEQHINVARAQIKSLRDEYPSPPPAVQALLAELEARLITVELNLARINLANLASDIKPEPTVPDSAMSVAAATGTANPVENGKAVEYQFAATPAPTVAPVADTANGFDVGVLLLGVMGFGIGLGTVLYRRTKGWPASSDPQVRVAEAVFGAEKGGAANAQATDSESEAKAAENSARRNGDGYEPRC
jgi:pilus assembly protein FimV